MVETITLTPLEDHHNHRSLYSVLDNASSLKDLRTAEETTAAIKSFMNNMENAGSCRYRPESKKMPVLFWGWNSGVWNPYSTEIKKELDKLPPLIICNLSLHSFFLNRSAAEVLKIIYHDLAVNFKDNLWVEKNLPFILSFLIRCGGLSEGKLVEYSRTQLGNGLPIHHDMLIDTRTLLAYLHSGLIKFTVLWAFPDVYRQMPNDLKPYITGFKIFADGALGAYTAALKTSYKRLESHDAASAGGYVNPLSAAQPKENEGASELVIKLPSTARPESITDKGKNRGKYQTGILLMGSDDIVSRIKYAMDEKKSISIHCIGDRAVSTVIEGLIKSRSQGIWTSEVRLEHCQFISLENAKEAKALGVILSMQPNFSLDSIYYKDRLENHYLSWNNPFRMLIDRAGFKPGYDLIFGTDGMPADVAPVLESSLFPPYPDQTLTLDEFKAGFAPSAISSVNVHSVPLKSACTGTENNNELTKEINEIIEKGMKTEIMLEIDPATHRVRYKKEYI
ncbi:MAG: amidohydrolase family protein [Thermoplasmata archaeon]